jgi:BirA family biotin operon repressor/biotin-[acetyl-CoA-carboxylase] ligase
MIFGQYADHPMPWLIGMSVALAAAAAAHCLVRWPNDLILDGKKLGGILTEVFTGTDGRRIPVVGIGINVNVREFPEALSTQATSLVLHRPDDYDVEELLRQVLARLEELPEPTSWQAIEPIWMQFDCTPGKRFFLPSGEEAVAIGIGPSGALIASVGGETRVVLSAESAMTLLPAAPPASGDHGPK